jgi:hypothetical protein
VLVIPADKNESVTIVTEIMRLPGVENGLFGLEGQVVASAPGKEPLDITGVCHTSHLAAKLPSKQHQSRCAVECVYRRLGWVVMCIIGISVLPAHKLWMCDKACCLAVLPLQL